MRWRALPSLLTLLASLVSVPVRANDGAAEVAAGGITLRSEPRVAMRKERLFISLDKVKVEYEFVNESSADVVTEVAFPIPEYRFAYAEPWGATFDDFRAWVDGVEVQVTTEVRAVAGEQDVTRRLEALGIDIKSFGHFEEDPPGPQVEKLPAATIAALHAEGLIGMAPDDEPYAPRWAVRVTKHWTQRFPAGRVVKVSHEYSPVPAVYSHVVGVDGACLPPATESQVRSRGGLSSWVKYILTTANTWKTPIRDFELRVEHQDGIAASFCWDGKIERAGPRTLKAARKDFVPKRELTVYFYRFR
jgi:hypothetical protein